MAVWHRATVANVVGPQGTEVCYRDFLAELQTHCCPSYVKFNKGAQSWLDAVLTRHFDSRFLLFWCTILNQEIVSKRFKTQTLNAPFLCGAA